MNKKRNTIALIFSLCLISTARADFYSDNTDFDSDPSPSEARQYQTEDNSYDSYQDQNGDDYNSNSNHQKNKPQSAERPKNYSVSYNDYFQDSLQDSYDDTRDEYAPPKRKIKHHAKARDMQNDNFIHNEENDNEISGSAYATKNAPLPELITAPLEKVIIVDPRKHAWGAYEPSGKLLRWGLATAGGAFCSDIGRSCRTKTGTFRMYSLGDGSCYSKRYPVPGGGAPMPYCMYFNGNQGIHGSNEVVYGNKSHGCVRVHVADAEWLRYQFVEAPNNGNGYRGTKVIIKPY